MATGCRRRRSGRRPRGVGWPGRTSPGARIRSATAKQIITVLHPTLATLVRRGVSIRPTRWAAIPTVRRLGALRRTGMGCMTWRGTCWSGVGIGVALTLRVHRSILGVQHRACIGCTGAAVGTGSAGATAGRRAAARATSLVTRITTSGSASPAVQSVSSRRARNERNGIASERERVQQWSEVSGAVEEMTNDETNTGVQGQRP